MHYHHPTYPSLHDFFFTKNLTYLQKWLFSCNFDNVNKIFLETAISQCHLKFTDQVSHGKNQGFRFFNFLTWYVQIYTGISLDK